LATRPSENELDEIVGIAVKMQEIDYQPPFVYDSWAINNFVAEFDKKAPELAPQYLKLVRPVYEQFKKFDYDSLPKGYVHGDMLVTNLIKDQNNKIWLVDYSVANYTVRLNEVAVICCDLATVIGGKEQTLDRIARVFDQWCKMVKATDAEKVAFPLLLDVANAIHVMNSAHEKQHDNDSSENEYYLRAGLFGLKLSGEESTSGGKK
jgi:aminoglycoside phosphotransferase (APT) family kinase protein